MDDFSRWLNGQFTVCLFDGISKYAPTHEPYITYETKFYFSEKEAVEHFIEIIKSEISSQKGTLYWRIRPEVKFSKAHFERCADCEEITEDLGILSRNFILEIDDPQEIYADEDKVRCNKCVNGYIKCPDKWKVRARFLISEASIDAEFIKNGVTFNA